MRVQSDVALPACGEEPVGATSRIGSQHHLPFGESGIIAGAMTYSDRCRKLVDCGVQHGDVIDHGVRTRVTRP